jgi:hypothetical protein
MKQLILSTICIITLSCNKSGENSHEIESLQKKISMLEEQNRNLKDSLSKSEAEFLYSQILIGIPYEHKQKVGKKNKIAMLLQTFKKKLPKYEIYRVIDGKEIKVGESDETRFDYEFTPKSVEDDRPDFLIKMPYKGKIIKIPGGLILDVEK